MKTRFRLFPLLILCLALFLSGCSMLEKQKLPYQPQNEVSIWMNSLAGLSGVEQGKRADALRKSRAADLRAGFSTVGIHRDDLEMVLDDADARIYASQGQRRSVVLSIKIAELELIGTVTGITPVLLLDDVLSELDDARQDYLLNRIEGKQVFITSCNPGLFQKTGGKIVTIENGRLAD